MNISLTPSWLQSNYACPDGVSWLSLQNTIDSIEVLKLLRDQNKWLYFHWLAPRLMTHAEKVEWALFAAEQILPIFERKYPKNGYVRACIVATKKFMAGQISCEDLLVARRATTNYIDYAAYTATAAAAVAVATAAVNAAAAADDAVSYAVDYVAAEATANAYTAARTKMRSLTSNNAIEILSRKTPTPTT